VLVVQVAAVQGLLIDVIAVKRRVPLVQQILVAVAAVVVYTVKQADTLEVPVSSSSRYLLRTLHPFPAV
jgi:LysM repeat protein